MISLIKKSLVFEMISMILAVIRFIKHVFARFEQTFPYQTLELGILIVIMI